LRQKAQYLQDHSEVVANGCHQGINFIAEQPSELIPAQATFGFLVTNDGFNSTSAFEKIMGSSLLLTYS